MRPAWRVIGSPYGARSYRLPVRVAARARRRGDFTSARRGPRKRVADGRNVNHRYVVPPATGTPSLNARADNLQKQKPERRPTARRRTSDAARNRNYTLCVAPRSTEITQPSARQTTPADRPPPHGPSASHPQSSPHSMIRTHVIQQTRSSCGSGALPASPPVKPPTARRPGRREPASRQRGRRARRMRVAAVAWSHAWAPPTLRLTSSCRRPATRPLACRSFGQRSRDG